MPPLPVTGMGPLDVWFCVSAMDAIICVAVTAGFTTWLKPEKVLAAKFA